MDNWYVPITLLPSIGFFIVATSSVSNSLSAEIARLIELGREENMEIVSRKLKQLRLINIVLVILFGSAVLFAVSGLIAGLEFNFMTNMRLFIEILVCAGIGLVVVAMVALMMYAIRAVRIKEDQFKNR